MTKQNSILSHCTSGGCGAKIGPGELSALLAALPRHTDPQLLVGYDSSDDAAVYQITPELCLISTADFFSPMVDDCYTFGKIAAANALSDVYAMGGRPVVALNLVCFPQHLPSRMLSEMLEGGAQVIAEAGATLGGGHSIYDKEPKYGLAVTGLVETNRIIRNNTPQIGHALLLTKPLGVGIVLAAARGDMASDESMQAAVQSMQRLNRYAAEKMQGFAVSACTDITGFGLLAHLLEMCEDQVSAEIYPHCLPTLPHALEYAQEYLLTAAGQRNRNYFGNQSQVEQLPFALQEILFDPQTSGGLLICVESQQADRLLAEIQSEDPQARIIGQIIPRQEEPVVFVGGR